MIAPNFIVIGAAKSGTTSIYHYLDQHPSVYLSPVPKTNFFTTNFVNGKPNPQDFDFTSEQTEKLEFLVTELKAYQELFADASPNQTAIGEISPMYLNSFVAAEKIKSYNPDVKLIAILRNPIDRAYSGYQMQVRQTNETRDFKSNVDPEEVYIRGGFYYNQLKRFFDVFEPEQIKIVIFDDFKQNPLRVIKSIFNFIQVDDTFVPNLSTKFNKGGVPKNTGFYNFIFSSKLSLIIRKTLKPLMSLDARRQLATYFRTGLLSKPQQMTSETRDCLKKIYQEDILKLEQLINRDLKHWLK